MTVEWTENMSTGVPEIDDEHKEWIRRFNEFDKALTGEHNTEHMYIALRFFEIYTKFHFGHEEERVLNKISQQAMKNRKEHGMIRNLIRDLKERIKNEGAGLVEVVEVKMEMDKWLVDHIMKTDIRLFEEERQSSSR